MICLGWEFGQMQKRAKQEIELINDGHETERFVDALRKIVSVSKKDVDAQMEKERTDRAKVREQKRKA